MKTRPLAGRLEHLIIIAVYLLCWHCAMVFATGAAASPLPSRFERTVAALQADPTGQVNTFAGIALAKLADAYAEEARLAREQASRAGRNSNLWGWSAGVEEYARQLSRLREDIESGAPARLIMGNGTSPAVAVADQVVILNHPRPSQQDVLEQGILQEFCARQSCDAAVLEGSENREGSGPMEGTEPIPVYTGQVRPAWSFMQDGPSCAHRGITVKFTSERSLSNSRTICEQLMREVEVLGEELAWQVRHAVAIDWEGMRLEAAQESPQHTVRLNAAGDVLIVSVPLLYSTPGVLRQIVPWLQRSITGEQAPDIVLEADEYGWQDSELQTPDPGPAPRFN